MEPKPVAKTCFARSCVTGVVLAAAFALTEAKTCVAQSLNRADPPAESIAAPIRADEGLIEDPMSLPLDSVAAPDLTATIPSTLTVADVVASVYRSYPEINQARQAAQLAQGQLTEAYGAYDTKLKGFTLSEPSGFYENYRHGIGVARQIWWGGNVAAGYRVGRGVFQPWYLERETEKGGEFKVALSQPLLRGRAIDPQRIAIFRSSLARQAADPIVQEALLYTSRDALSLFWEWVAAGATLQARKDLLEVAESRGEQFQVGFQAGKFAEIDVVLNRQLIAERRAQALEAQRKFRATALKLSMYLRDDVGNPLIPADPWLPSSFPVIEPLPPENLDEDISLALMQRPEPRMLQIELRQLELDRRVARNQTLPRFDFVVQGSQDVGLAASKSDDKGEFVLVIGAEGEVPIQRRKARGKLLSTAAKIAQVNEKLRLQQDKIAVEIRMAYSNLSLLTEVVQQAELALQTAFDSLDRYRFAFDRGKIDLIYLNLLETKAYETEIKLIESRQKWFAELAAYQAAAGLDPIDQANVVTGLPLSPPPFPTNEDPTPADPEAFDRDWQLHIGEPAAP